MPSARRILSAALVAAGLVSGLAALAQQGEAPADPATPTVEMSAADQTWMVALARVEGAAIDVKQAAATLSESSGRVAKGGRLAALAELSSDASEVNRRVISAGLAVDVLVEAAGAPVE